MKITGNAEKWNKVIQGISSSFFFFIDTLSINHTQKAITDSVEEMSGVIKNLWHLRVKMCNHNTTFIWWHMAAHG